MTLDNNATLIFLYKNVHVWHHFMFLYFVSSFLSKFVRINYQYNIYYHCFYFYVFIYIINNSIAINVQLMNVS